MTDYEQVRGASMQIFIKLAGQDWQELNDPDQNQYLFYCRDQRNERLEEAIVILGNSAIDPRDRLPKPTDRPSSLFATDIGCWRWIGTATRTNSYDNYRETTSVSQIQWDRDTAIYDMTYPMVSYNLSKGNATWTMSDQWEDCTMSGSGNFIFPGTGDSDWLRTFNGVLGKAGQHGVMGSAESGQPTQCTAHCSGEPQACGSSLGSWFQTSLPWEAGTMSGSGGTMTGTFTDGDMVYEWNLTAQREP